MSTLHTINNSPFESSSLESCLNHVSKGDAVLLIESAAFDAERAPRTASSIKGAMGNCKVYALAPDLSARGMNEDTVLDGIELVDYGGFVDLVAEHERTQAWL